MLKNIDLKLLIKLNKLFKNSRVNLTLLYKLPKTVAVFYVLTLLAVFLRDKSLFLGIALPPLFSLIAVSVLRRVVKRARPFETVAVIVPLKEHSAGKSFPSRHTASAFSIALAMFKINAALGVVFTAIAVIIAVSRIGFGLHYPSDIAAAVLLSLFFAIFFSGVIPFFPFFA